MNAQSEVTLHLGDCLEYMKSMPDKSIDCVLTDPPYGENIGKMGFATSTIGGVAQRNDYRGMADWDGVGLSPEQFSQIKRISHIQAIFGGNFFTDFLPVSRCWYAWDKKEGGKYSNDFADIELVWTSQDAPSRVIRHVWHGMIQQDMKNKETRVHPAQKPVAVVSKIIIDLTQPNDTIFDPFMGSGTTGVACVQTGRNFIGCEIDPDYYAIAEKRIAEAQLQLRMPI